ncbi:zinc-dependent metalloprotease [Arsenicicoccus sp. oral taxon 190]|uniref:zinc-dependent metalloprotease n=1 Tax=Arsenicicoccus sp. oral taxon 190 TaxID=1658671 RepID=UPI00067A03CD|nr:zinc-dependent metalloprotease [Arsenicicoccus sp. oral taxon 190]AKT51168.1 coenzyme F420 biosynthesis protein [Arsenicicoccus sp. oral taxon 190]
MSQDSRQDLHHGADRSSEPVRPVGPVGSVGSVELVDWDFAAATARRLVPRGPRVSRAEAADAVRELRAAAAASAQHVADTSHLHAPASAEPARVVDRPGWIDANVESLRGMIAPVTDKLLAARPSGVGPTAAAVGGKVTGGETGALMAFLASKVLGQYDLAPGGTPRLLLVAPNVVEVERELDVDPRDFRMWVCLHEETHRVQFTAVPWLRQHLLDRTRELSVELVPDADQLAARLAQMVRNLPDVLREGGNGLSDLVTTPQQREEIARITAVMSLLEGHADVIMDDVGPAVIPTVDRIRTTFDQRRGGRSSLDRVIRRLLGLEAKMRQYSEGAAFVRGVVDTVGMDGFNQVWTSPETLPTPAEIGDHRLWLRRVHG